MRDPCQTFEMLMKNGTPYQVQPCVEPGTSHTPAFLKGQIVAAMEHLSVQTRRHRFFSPISGLSDKQLEHLTNLDGKSKVAWCATIQTEEGEKGIGLARYMRTTSEKQVAEFALTVVDEFQGQGIGCELLKKLLESAKENQIEKLKGLVLAGNKHMLSLCQHFDACIESTRDYGILSVEILVDRT